MIKIILIFNYFIFLQKLEMSNFDLILVIIALIIIIVLAICLVHYVNNHKNIDDDKGIVDIVPDVPRIQAFDILQEKKDSSQILFRNIDIQENINISISTNGGSVFRVIGSGTYSINFNANFEYQPNDTTNDENVSWSTTLQFMLNNSVLPQGEVLTQNNSSVFSNVSSSIILDLDQGDTVSTYLTYNTPNGFLLITRPTFTMYRITI